MSNGSPVTMEPRATHPSASGMLVKAPAGTSACGPDESLYTRATMAVTMGGEPARVSKSVKNRLSSDCTLQLECMKSESLVIVDQHATVNTFPGLVHTARHTMGVGFTRSR